MADNQILVAVDEKRAYLRAIGRATFACCPALRKFALKILDTDIPRIGIDLADCRMMDSTFLGVLAMIAIRGKEKSVAVEIVATNEKADEQLARLGLKQLFTYSTADKVNPRWIDLDRISGETGVNKTPMKRTILEAHETLASVDSKNVAEFKDVIELLKKDLEEDSTQ
jgi:anti-anti-sigma regulatory factor